MTTKTATHTPGPWRVVQQRYDTDNDTDIRGPLNSDKSSEYIATMSGCNDTPENARLIAAAPQMLEALEFFVEQAISSHPCEFVNYEVAEEFSKKAEAAIRAAKGEL